jgi:hypothetical protein
MGATRGVRTANFASVRVFSGRLIADGRGPRNTRKGAKKEKWKYSMGLPAEFARQISRSVRVFSGRSIPTEGARETREKTRKRENTNIQ